MKRLGLWAFIVAGIAVVVWALSSWISPSVVCRGVEMGPGDTCEYSSRTNEHTGTTQTYEERVVAARSQAPFGVAAGLGMVGFGVWVLRQDTKRSATAAVNVTE